MSVSLQSRVHLAVCTAWDRTVEVLQKELTISRARLEASATHDRARDQEVSALREQLDRARAALDYLQEQNLHILGQLEQVRAPRG